MCFFYGLKAHEKIKKRTLKSLIKKSFALKILFARTTDCCAVKIQLEMNKNPSVLIEKPFKEHFFIETFSSPAKDRAPVDISKAHGRPHNVLYVMP